LGTIWVATSAGFAKFDGADFVVFNSVNSPLPNNFVYNLTFDSNHILWIGSNGGLTKYDGVNWETFSSSNSGLPLDLVRTIAILSADNLVVGTEGQGVAVFNSLNLNWNHFSTSNSNISSNYIKKIVVDLQQKQWIATDNGIDLK
jgi:ligand-binding sensor domain-containing protein